MPRKMDEDVVVLLKRFVEIESFTHDLDGIAAMATELEKTFSPFANEISHLGTAEDKRHLKMTFGKGERQLLLLSHLDTVHPKGMIHEFPWKVADGKAFGPGVLDIKSSYVMVYEILKDVASDLKKFGWRLVWLNTGDEEIGSPSGKNFVIEEAKKSEAVLVLEPALGKGALKTSRKGGGKYTITVHGRSAHAGVNPQDGLNAIVELAKLIDLIASQQDRAKGTDVTVGTISGGTLFNVVPDLATAEIDIRVRLNEEKERLELFFKKLVAFQEGIVVEVTGGIYRPPFIRSEGTAWLYSLAEQCARNLDIDLQEAETGGGSDGNFAALTGVPVLDGLGAIGGGAHSREEYVEIKSIVERAGLVSGIIKKVIEEAGK